MTIRDGLKTLGSAAKGAFVAGLLGYGMVSCSSWFANGDLEAQQGRMQDAGEKKLYLHQSSSRGIVGIITGCHKDGIDIRDSNGWEWHLKSDSIDDRLKTGGLVRVDKFEGGELREYIVYVRDYSNTYFAKEADVLAKKENIETITTGGKDITFGNYWTGKK